MKKKTRKLSLNRETLRNLQTGDLRRAAGGTNTSAACEEATHCDCDTQTGCPDSHLLSDPCTLLTRCACTFQC